MTEPTHLVTGLLIGRITGNYAAALSGSLVVDLDHFVSYYRHSLISKPRKLLKVMMDEKDQWGDQRNFMHGIFSWIVGSGLLMLINFQFGFVFSIAYFSHILLDAIDGADFWPYFPFQKLNLKGPIGYGSRREAVFCSILFLILIFVFIAPSIAQYIFALPR